MSYFGNIVAASKETAGPKTDGKLQKLKEERDTVVEQWKALGKERDVLRDKMDDLLNKIRYLERNNNIPKNNYSQGDAVEFYHEDTWQKATIAEIKSTGKKFPYDIKIVINFRNAKWTVDRSSIRLPENT